ncbi:MAG: FAD binding domain-containing protein [Candidatus Rokubacteria bacterium]|nr:FAD binding domain-containing protein [Candidatus Rokubacteria bacterium]
MADIPSRFVRQPNPAERKELARLRRERSSTLGLRAAIVHLSAQGVPVSTIMRHLRVSRPTVTLWLDRFDESGLAGLRDQRRPGRPPKLTTDVQRRIALVASSRPRDLGVQGAAWNLPKLREYLVRAGIGPALSLESLRTALRRCGLSLKAVPTGMTRKGTTMIPGAFEYYAPTSIPDAIGLLAKHGNDAKVLSGGQSLIPLMKLRLATPRHLIDINRIPALAYIREAEGVLKIGALTRESDLEESDLIRTRYPILLDTSRVIADPLVRNLATVCGNLAHGDPANDHPATMLALGAEVVAVAQRGERRIPVSSFFTGPFASALDPGEILTEIRIPMPPARSGGAYLKLERKVGDFATVAVAVQLTLTENGVCERAGIGLTNVGPTPIKARKAEGFLQGKRLDEGVMKRAAQIAAEESRPTSDLRGPAEYKRDLVRVLTVRALRKALERAGGGR